MPFNYTGLAVVRALAGREGPEVVISRNGDVNKLNSFFTPLMLVRASALLSVLCWGSSLKRILCLRGSQWSFPTTPAVAGGL